MIKGWFSKNKHERLESQYPTLQKIGVNRHGLDIIGNIGYFAVVSDTVDSMSSNGYRLTAAAHIARLGDTIRFSSGNANGVETRVVAITVNTIDLADTFIGDLSGFLPSAGDTFDILRARSVIVDEITGSIVTAPISTGPVQFTRNAATQTVIEDTVVPTLNRALPVKTINYVYATIFYDYTVPVDTVSWTQILAATTAITVKFQIFDSSGELLELGTGGLGTETRLLLITPGGNGTIEVHVPVGARLSIRAVSATASSQFLAINLLRE